jgi:hypothetical protein
MAMDRFSEAYRAARKTIRDKKKYVSQCQTFLNQKVAPILRVSGPKAAHAAGLDDLRAWLEQKGGQLHNTLVGDQKAAFAILHYSDRTNGVGFGERNAALKMLKHLYRVQQVGGQDIWVYAPPKAYSQWVFDEITGNETVIYNKLLRNREVYSVANRNVMCTALQRGKAYALQANTKLSAPNEATKDVFKRWFGDATGNTLTNRMNTMSANFQSLARVLGSTTMVFSDEPLDRNNGGWKDWGFVYTNKEKFPVVYVQKAFLNAAASGEICKCVITLVHELSHYDLSTEDYRYDNGGGDLGGGIGLKPGGTFTPAKAMNNADNLAFFCVDLAGVLAMTDRTEGLAGTAP